MPAVCSHFAFSPGHVRLLSPCNASGCFSPCPSAHNMQLKPVSVLFRRGGQAVSFKGFSKDNTVFVGKQVVGTKATGVCVVFYVAAKYFSIFA